MLADEQDRLESIAEVSQYAYGANEHTIEYSFSVFRRFIQGESLLELGPAEGIMTNHLAPLGLELTVVDASARFCEDLRTRFPGINVVQSLFEEFSPNRTFDNIVLGHVLEHVIDPVDILSKAKRMLSSSGRILAAVPNSRSLHRQAAVLMDLLPFEGALNESDHQHGHRRVYNPETFRQDFRNAGLEIEVFGGYWIKPLSNKQIEASWSDDMIRAFMVLGERYPDIAGEIYIVAKKSKVAQA